MYCNGKIVSIIWLLRSPLVNLLISHDKSFLWVSNASSAPFSQRMQLRPAPQLLVWLSGLRGFAPKAKVVSEANEMFTHSQWEEVKHKGDDGEERISRKSRCDKSIFCHKIINCFTPINLLLIKIHPNAW